MSAGWADRNPPPGDFLRYAALVTTICEGGPDTPSNLDALLVRLLPWRAFLSSSSQIVGDPIIGVRFVLEPANLFKSPISWRAQPRTSSRHARNVRSEEMEAYPSCRS